MRHVNGQTSHSCRCFYVQIVSSSSCCFLAKGPSNSKEHCSVTVDGNSSPLGRKNEEEFLVLHAMDVKNGKKSGSIETCAENMKTKTFSTLNIQYLLFTSPSSALNSFSSRDGYVMCQ